MPNGFWWGGFGKSFPEGVDAGAKVAAVRAEADRQRQENLQAQQLKALQIVKSDVDNYVTYVGSLNDPNDPRWLKDNAGPNWRNHVLAEIQDTSNLMLDPTLKSSLGTFSGIVNGAKFANELAQDKGKSEGTTKFVGDQTQADMMNAATPPASTDTAPIPGTAVTAPTSVSPATPATPTPSATTPPAAMPGPDLPQEDVTNAQPIPLNAQTGRPDPEQMSIGAVYTNGSQFGVWDGENIVPVQSAVQQPVDYSAAVPQESDQVTAKDVAKIPKQVDVTPEMLKMYDEGRAPPPSMGRNAQNAKIIAALAKVPGYNTQKYAMRTLWSSGPMAETKRAMNQTAAHAREMDDAFKKLKNHGLTSMNEAKARWKAQWGENPYQAFQLAKQAVTSELANAWAGKAGRTQEELRQWQDALDRADTPETFYNTMATMSRLMLGAETSQKGKYRSVMGHDAQFLSPSAQAIFHYFIKRGDSGSVKLPSFGIVDSQEWISQHPELTTPQDTSTATPTEE